MVTTALVFFAIVSILVLVHEVGHFAVARWIGVEVEEFGLGLPPRIMAKRIGRTVYSLNWLPIGGFVKLAGEDEEDVSLKRPRLSRQGEALKKYFWARSKGERTAILLAGVTMNFLLAVVLTGSLLTQGVLEPSGRVRIAKVQPGSPAEAVGLRESDVVKKIGDRPISTPSDLIEATRAQLGKEVHLTIVRSGKEVNIALIPRTNPPQGQGPLGIVITDLEHRSFRLQEIPWEAVRINLIRARDMVIGVGVTLWKLVRLEPLAADVAGPIGIARYTGAAVLFGWKAVVEFMSILSLNLAILNILPIPALDGGRLAFVFLEKLMGRRLRPAFERRAHQIGMILLLTFLLLVSIHDILGFTKGL